MGHPLLSMGPPLLSTGHPLLLMGHPLLIMGYPLLFMGHPLLIMGHPLLPMLHTLCCPEHSHLVSSCSYLPKCLGGSHSFPSNYHMPNSPILYSYIKSPLLLAIPQFCFPQVLFCIFLFPAVSVSFQRQHITSSWVTRPVSVNHSQHNYKSVASHSSASLQHCLPLSFPPS